jgi:sodium-dependent phosphate cotransporter
MRGLGGAAAVYALLVGVATIGDGFFAVSGGREGARAIFEFASNPVLGVICGLLATALVQSSSTVTAVIVGLVAGGLPVGIAIPMILGANVGTTVTNTIVSLGSATESASFRRAFAAASVHDIFNLLALAIFLPIEVAFGVLERASAVLAGAIGGQGFAAGGGSVWSPDALIDPAASLVGTVVSLGGIVQPPLAGILMIAVGVGGVVGAVLALGAILRAAMTGTARGILDHSLGRGRVRGAVAGAITTVLVQSSSTTTSLVVPLAGAGAITLRQVYPFTVGANVGTAVTALIAAFGVQGPHAETALQIALVHLLYNTLAGTVFLAVPLLSDVPVRGAEWLSAQLTRSKLAVPGYVLAVFFGLPGLLIMSTKVFIG